MKSLSALVDELESKVPHFAKSNPAVSQASVGWHIEHSLIVLIKSVSAAEHSNPAEYIKQFSWKWIFVSLTGKIPRGRAKAPSFVQPEGETTAENLLPVFEKARQKIAALEMLGPDKFFRHPVFGPLKLKQAKKVMAIHTAHHLYIIEDIVGK